MGLYLSKSFSYSCYDLLGRIREAGEFATKQNIYIDDNGKLVNPVTGEWVGVDSVGDDNYPHNVSTAQKEVTRTLYDNYGDFQDDINVYLSDPENNTRNRVTAILTFAESSEATPNSDFETAIFYNYDIHGNIDEMAQVLSQSVIDIGEPIIKRVNYEYDLISGNVNKVIYQKDASDQFIHKYNYDADNRVTDVQTSSNGTIWETDATYEYYDHGR
ncbi:hypothetical protein [Flavobacterium sp. 3HN19-14]|uniref:hypothetical protein n=1 Tax=Flavobacterium sp. 3HN19-14 TaxID=3448133 RepID=UPI003EDEDC9A